MTEAHETPQADSALPPEPQFRALLTPHRSLSPTGFLVLMSVICFISFTTGIAFFLIGAWPVFGFCGLDVALIYFAFKLNYRSGRLVERVDLTENSLTVTRVQPSGYSESWRFNPYWVRVSVVPRIGLSSEMSIASHGERLVFGTFLTDQEREEFAGALKDALAQARGPRLAPA
jgi:uncharacterized membrane protein